MKMKITALSCLLTLSVNVLGQNKITPPNNELIKSEYLRQNATSMYVMGGMLSLASPFFVKAVKNEDKLGITVYGAVSTLSSAAFAYGTYELAKSIMMRKKIMNCNKKKVFFED